MFKSERLSITRIKLINLPNKTLIWIKFKEKKLLFEKSNKNHVIVLIVVHKLPLVVDTFFT